MSRDDSGRLSEARAKQVLERAAQLDASDRMGVSVPDLRSAALEAGISSSAVDQALSEIENAQPDVDTAQSSRRRRRRMWPVVAIVAVVVALLLGMLRNRLVPQNEPARPPAEAPAPR